MAVNLPTPVAADSGAAPPVQAPHDRADAAFLPTGIIEGTIRLNGPLPPPRPVPLDAEWARRQGCAEAARGVYANAFPITAPGPLPWAVVLVNVPREHNVRTPAPRNRVATWRDCSITPPVLLMSLNDRLTLHAETDQHHLVKVDGMGSTIAQMLNRNEDQEKPILRPGRYILHSVNYPNWMQSPLIVTPNVLYDQSNTEGRYRIVGVPAGEATVHAWYPNARDTQATVTVRAGEVTTQDFVLNPVPTQEIVPLQPPVAADAGPAIP